MKVNAIYKISDNPIIYLSIGSKNWDQLSISNKKAYLLVHPMFYYGWHSLFYYAKWAIKLKKKRIILILLHNSKREYLFSKIFYYNSYFISQNIHTSEKCFSILSGIQKEFDAVYTAQALSFKRIYLAKNIHNLYIITYFWPLVVNEKGEWDLYSFEPRVKHAAFNKTTLNQQEINIILNKSFCGLALSKREDAMFGSMEYLLAGIPIVSTKSIGGRDVFFDERFVKIVEANPNSIADAVIEFKNKNIDPNYIRSETLKKIDRHRKHFYELIMHLYKNNNCQSETYDSFKKRIWGNEGIQKIRIM
jgi:glycosyltransferase involved in cell wall biosynthesis